jgi:hypothetical protein
MFIDWYGVDAQNVLGISATGGANAWQAYSLIDVILALICIVTVGTALLSASGSGASEDFPLGAITAGLGGFALILILFRIVDPPNLGEASGVEFDVSLKIGIFLGLISAAGIVFGGYAAMTEGAPSPRRRPGGRRPPVA